MRLVQSPIPEGRRTAALDVLDDEGIDYAVFDETGRSEFEALVQFPVPESGVDPVELSGATIPDTTVVGHADREKRVIYRPAGRPAGAGSRPLTMPPRAPPMAPGIA